MSFSLTGSHAFGKGAEPDTVFAVLKKANDAIAAFGKDRVVNATIGAIYDEEERFVTLSAVNERFHNLPAEEMMNYAPIAGLPDFLQAALDFTFQGNQPAHTFARAVATPGGTGAVRHIFYNYLENGQKAMIPDWAWGAYKTIAVEHMRDVVSYAMFDENCEFTLSSVREKAKELLKRQDNLVVVFNTPGHNPTGYSMTEKDWREVLAFFKECAQDGKKRIVLLLDLAYIDYVGDSQETRKFLRLFTDLPPNLFITMAFSMSKSFCMYGQRSGAVIGLSSSEDVVAEFFRVCSFSNRGAWSNGARGAQRLLSDVMKDPQLKAAIDREREGYTRLILQRAGVFLREAKEVGLITLPYHGGFFITVPAAQPKEAAEKLAQDKIFVVPLKMGLRFAVCALPLKKIPGLAAKTKAAVEQCA